MLNRLQKKTRGEKKEKNQPNLVLCMRPPEIMTQALLFGTPPKLAAGHKLCESDELGVEGIRVRVM